MDRLANWEYKRKHASNTNLSKEMTEHDNNLLNISWLCETAGVSRSGFIDG